MRTTLLLAPVALLAACAVEPRPTAATAALVTNEVGPDAPRDAARPLAEVGYRDTGSDVGRDASRPGLEQDLVWVADDNPPEITGDVVCGSVDCEIPTHICVVQLSGTAAGGGAFHSCRARPEVCEGVSDCSSGFVNGGCGQDELDCGRAFCLGGGGFTISNNGATITCTGF